MSLCEKWERHLALRLLCRSRAITSNIACYLSGRCRTRTCLAYCSFMAYSSLVAVCRSYHVELTCRVSLLTSSRRGRDKKTKKNTKIQILIALSVFPTNVVSFIGKAVSCPFVFVWVVFFPLFNRISPVGQSVLNGFAE